MSWKIIITLSAAKKGKEISLSYFSRNSRREHCSSLSQCMRFLTMWYVRPAKPQISLRIRAVWSEPLLVAWVFYYCSATDLTPFGVSELKRRLQRFVWICTCRNATLLEITCTGSIFIYFVLKRQCLYRINRCLTGMSHGLSAKQYFWCVVAPICSNTRKVHMRSMRSRRVDGYHSSCANMEYRIRPNYWIIRRTVPITFQKIIYPLFK